MAAETHIISKVPLDSMSWVSRKNMTRQCGISVRPGDIAAGLEVQTFNLYGSLFDSVSGSTVAESEIPSDGSRKLFLVSEDQVGGTLDALMKAHRRPSEVAKVELDIPYSVVAGEATVTSVKLYAVSADSGSDNDITEKLTSKYYLKNADYTIPSEFEASGSEANLVATCDLSQAGVATGDITAFLKTTRYPAMALNITAVIEVSGTVATLAWCPGVGPVVRVTEALGNNTTYVKGSQSMADDFAYFSTTLAVGNSDVGGRISVELLTGAATIETDTDNSRVYEGIHGSLRVTELTHIGSIDGVSYALTFEVRNKLYSGQDTIEYTSATANSVSIPITASGEFTLNIPVVTPALFQPDLDMLVGADVNRIEMSSTDYDPLTAVSYHSLEFLNTEPRNRGCALLRDSDDKPVFVYIPPEADSTSGTNAKVSRLLIVDDSQYTDQYGTESRTVSLT